MNHLYLAFIIGLFGSLHCVGMCAPLAFGLPTHENRLLVFVEKLSYNLGRAISYALLGLLIGLIGKQLWIAGLQQFISIVCGALILIASIFRIFPSIKFFRNSNNSFYFPINNLIIKAINHKMGHFIIGLLNGFLPCGLVYVALATALNTDSALQSALFMFFFGLGTLPLMLIALLGFGFAKPAIKAIINKIIPLLMILLGIWFILRGLNLNIPYLSPLIGNGNPVICK